jgi:hypothetical protein
MVLFVSVASAQQPSNGVQEQVDSLRVIVNPLRRQLDSLILESPSRSKFTLFAEISLNGRIASLNADYLFHKNWGLRAGYSSLLTPGDGWATPIMIDFLTSDINSSGHLEVGVGIVPTFLQSTILDYGSNYSVVVGNQPSFLLGSTATIAYRYQPLEGGLNFRIGLMPLIYLGISSGPVLVSLIGFSLGYTF